MTGASSFISTNSRLVTTYVVTHKQHKYPQVWHKISWGKGIGIGLHNDSVFVMSIQTVIKLAILTVYTFTERHESQG